MPIFLSKQETDANFEKQARVVMENHAWEKIRALNLMKIRSFE
jgi:hypothetical protein